MSNRTRREALKNRREQMASFALPIPELPWGKRIISMASSIVPVATEEGTKQVIQLAFAFADGSAVGMILTDDSAQVVVDDLAQKASEIRTGLKIVDNGSRPHIAVPTPRRIKDNPQA